MKGIRGGLAAFAAAIVISPCAAAPLELYGKLPSVEEAQISPDGNLLALVVTNGEQRMIVVERASDQQIQTRLNAGDQKVRDIQWAGSDHLLVTTSVAGYARLVNGPRGEWFMATDFNVVSGKQTRLLSNWSGADMNVIYGVPMVRMVRGEPKVFVAGVHFVGGEGQDSLYEVDVDHGSASLKDDAGKNTDDWLVDTNGDTLAEAEFNSDSLLWTLKIKRDGFWRTAKQQTGLDTPDLVGLGRDGKSALLADGHEDQVVLREFASNADDWGPPLATAGAEAAIFDPVTGNLIGVHMLDGDQDRYTFFDPHDQAIWDATVKAYPDQAISLVSMSADHKKLVVLADSPMDGPAYALVDLKTGQGDWIANEFEGLKPDDIGPKQPIAFKAADGTPLSGYLTLPHGRDPKGLPLIVFPHGGPQARDDPGYDWWAQAMASRGYAVMQVNYRGSAGFGWKFQSAGFGEWGGKMQTDLSDGVRYLATQGTIDPARVCIVGGSYGGYAALAGATLDRGVYRCAVSVAGISDLGRFVTWVKGQESQAAARYLDRYTGAKDPGDPHLRDISPADHVDASTPPILLIHGKDDTVVPFEQSQVMADALAKAGKPADIVVLNHEDHWLSHGDTRLQMLEAVMDFLAKNNPAG